MATVMCAVFEDTRRAEQALRALEEGGFPRHQMDVRSGDELAEQPRSERRDRGNEGLWGRIRRLFEDEPASSEQRAGKSDSARYDSSKQAASTIVSGDDQASGIADSEVVLILNAADERIGQAAEILGDNGALNLDQRLGQAVDEEPSTEPIYAVVIEEVELDSNATSDIGRGPSAAG